MDAEIQDLLDEGIALLRAGRKDEARSKLMQVINAEERNEYAWFYLSEVVETDEDRRICLENVLAINPTNEQAETTLEALEAKIREQTEAAGILCPSCGAINQPGSQRCLSCHALLGEAVAPPPPFPGESPSVEPGDEERPGREAQHKSFLEMLDTWAEMFALPQKERLDEEHSYARWRLAVLGIFIASGIAYFFLSLTNVGSAWLMPGSTLDLAQSLSWACGGTVGGTLVALISFFAGSGLLYLVARLFQGKGEFVVQSYLLSLIYAPLSIVFGIISPLMLLASVKPILAVIPGLLSIPLGIVALVMSIRALKSAHGYSTGAALGTLLLPGIGFSCIGCLSAWLLAGSLLATLPFAGLGFPASAPEIAPTLIQPSSPLPGSEPRVDIPIPAEANVTLRSATEIQYDIFQSPEAVGTYYQSQMPLQGWIPDPQNFVEAEVVRLTYTQPNASVFIQASASGDHTRVIISISEF